MSMLNDTRRFIKYRKLSPLSFRLVSNGPVSEESINMFMGHQLGHKNYFVSTKLTYKRLGYTVTEIRLAPNYEGAAHV